ncbi:MAG: hypothetical protein SFU98_17400 [Leptospiraceae bacterium]|nr:hypothetical protein [Leptospiraceae bacterium]
MNSVLPKVGYLLFLVIFSCNQNEKLVAKKDQCKIYEALYSSTVNSATSAAINASQSTKDALLLNYLICRREVNLIRKEPFAIKF